MSANSFLDLIGNPLLRADGVIRYSGLVQINNESLSQHIYDVSIISYIIAKRVNQLGYSDDVDELSLLESCLFHDMDETLVGDIPRLTKYATKECHDELNKIADLAAKGISDKTLGNQELYHVWNKAKDDSLGGQILKLADMLSVAKKCIQEVKFGNNLRFLQVVKEVSEYLDDLHRDVVDRHRSLYNEKQAEYIKDIILSTKAELVSIYISHKNEAIRYNTLDSISAYMIDNRCNKEE